MKWGGQRIKLVTILILTVVAVGGMTNFALPAEKKEGRFEPVGIGGGGKMYAPTSSPHNPEHLYATCNMGGFYTSLDNGQTWQMAMFDELQGCQPCRPAFHPKDPNIMYVPYGKRTKKLGMICISRDKGLSWEVMNSDPPWRKKKARALSIRIDPDDPEFWFVATTKGLYQSNDGGKTFSKCSGLDGSVIDVHISLASPKGARRCVAGGVEGVFASTDSGKTWVKKGAGIEGAMKSPKYNGPFSAGTDMETGKIYCYVSTEKALFYSHDNAETFHKAEGLPDIKFGIVSACESKGQIAYVTNFGMYAKWQWGAWKTEDGGKTWKKVFKPWGKDEGGPGNVTFGWLAYEFSKGWGGNASGFAVNDKNPDVALYTNWGELFLTTDGGKTWVEKSNYYMGKKSAKPKKGDPWVGNGLHVAGLHAVYIDPKDGNNILAAYGDIGIWVSRDKDKSWRSCKEGVPKGWRGNLYAIVFHPTKKDMVYAAMNSSHNVMGWREKYAGRFNRGGGLLVSTNNGESWQVLGKEILPQKSACVSFVLEPGNPDTIYAAFWEDGVWKSADGGKTWQKKSKGLGREGNMHCRTLAFAKDGTLYCVVAECPHRKGPHVPGGLWKTTDGGENWIEVLNLTAPGPKLGLDPNNPKRILVTDGNRKKGGIWITEDGGKAWTQTKVTLKKIPAHAEINVGDHVPGYGVAFHPWEPNVAYYFTYRLGPLISEDGGKTWRRLKGVPPHSTIWIAFDPDDQKTIYLCGTGTGIWKGPAKGF